MMRARYPDLAGKSVFISGGATGIGAALVAAFAEQGARTGFVDVAVAEGQALAGRLNAEGHRVTFRACDITDIPAYQAAIAGLAAVQGPVAVLVNNAANDVRHTLEGLTPESFDAHVAVNLRHAIFAAQAVAPGMRAAGGGSIINFGSISWMMAAGGFPAYATCKAAAHGMTRTLARDLGPFNIRVNTLVPGWVMTEKQVRLWLDDAGRRRIAENQCLPGALEPRHIADMALFLGSAASAMCSAQNFVVDGGWV